MSKLDHDIAVEGWPMRWVERDVPGLRYYVAAISIILGSSLLFIAVRGLVHTIRARRDLAANPSDRAAIFKKIDKWALKSSKGQLKIALLYMAHSYVITIIDGGIACFMLAKDISEHSEVWNKEMVIPVALYTIYTLVLFVSSFILVPMLQVLVVTWGLTKFSRKGNTLSDYLPLARSWSTLIALIWSMAAFMVVFAWPIAGKSGEDQTTLRFLVLEGVWGSAMAWLEASISFCYLSHAINDKELDNGNGVAQIVSLFFQAAAAPFKKSKPAGLPVYAEVAQDEAISEKQ